MPSCDGSEGFICEGRIYRECDSICSRVWSKTEPNPLLIGFDGEESWQRVEVIRAAPESGEAPTQEVTIRPSRDMLGRKVWTIQDGRMTLSFPEKDFFGFHLGSFLFETSQLPKHKRFKITILPWEE